MVSINNDLQIIESASSRTTIIDLSSKLLQSGIIEICDEFNPNTVSSWRNALLYLKTKFTPEENVPIQIYINSPGGDVYSMFGLYDTIQLMKKEGYVISTINVGMAASCAAIILLSGSKGYRKSLKNCRIMLHTVSSGIWDKFPEIISHAREVENVQTILNNIIIEHSSTEVLELYKNSDFWLSSEDAIKYNIIDYVV